MDDLGDGFASPPFEIGFDENFIDNIAEGFSSPQFDIAIGNSITQWTLQITSHNEHTFVDGTTYRWSTNDLFNIKLKNEGPECLEGNLKEFFELRMMNADQNVLEEGKEKFVIEKDQKLFKSDFIHRDELMECSDANNNLNIVCWVRNVKTCLQNN